MFLRGRAGGGWDPIDLRKFYICVKYAFRRALYLSFNSRFVYLLLYVPWVSQLDEEAASGVGSWPARQLAGEAVGEAAGVGGR